MHTIFSGVRILDLTKVFSGPFATRQFADYGAEVLKIEHSDYPDDSRFFAPLKNNWSGYFEILNRNKKGIALDLKSPLERKRFYNLCKEADVIVENLTPQTKHTLQISYDQVKKINRGIIYASLSGKGQALNKKYYDIIAQAESGLMSLSGEKDHPMKIGPSVVDAYSGMTLAFAISSALFYRERTKKGQFIDVSMLAASMNLLESNLINYSITKENPIRTGDVDNTIAPFGIYKTMSGFIALAIGNNKQWEKFKEFLITHQKVDEKQFQTNELRVQHNRKLKKVIESVFKKYSTEKIMTLLESLHIACAKVNEMSDVYNDSFLYKSGSLKKITHKKLGSIVVPGKAIVFSAGNDTPFSPAPLIGEHMEEYEL